VRYVHLPFAAVDTALLEDATRRGTSNATFWSQQIETLTYLLSKKPHRKRRKLDDIRRGMNHRTRTTG